MVLIHHIGSAVPLSATYLIQLVLQYRPEDILLIRCTMSCKNVQEKSSLQQN